MTVLVYPDSDSLAKVTAARLCLTLADAGALRPLVHVAIAGGSVGTEVLAAVPGSELASEVNWENIHIWWVDERFVPAGDPDRNDAAVDPVFAKLPIPGGNLHRVPGPEEAASVAGGAAAYAATLEEFAPTGAKLPLFDVVLLGMGPDGHVASLFPDHPGLGVDSEGIPEAVTLSVTDSPKPPLERVSLSMAAINHSREVWIAAWGAQKAPAIASAIAGAGVAQIPAAGAQGAQATLWLTDLAGASGLGQG